MGMGRVVSILLKHWRAMFAPYLCFCHAPKVGLDVALEALREARRAKKASADEL